MATRIVKVDPAGFDPAVLEEPAAALARGELVVFPTETVYGVGVRLDLPQAVERLLEARESPHDKRISAHIGDRDDVLKLGVRITVAARRLMARFWPGPLTIVFPRTEGGTLGVRFPSDPVARELIRRCRVLVGAPSANLSGRPPATDGQEALRALGDRVEWLIDAGPTRHRQASSVVDATGRRARVLREGIIPARVIEEVNRTIVLLVCSGNTCRSPMAAGLLRRLLAERHGCADDDLEARGISILSAGTAAGTGAPPSEGAARVLREMGVDISGHRSQPVTTTILEEADLVFAMTRSQVETLREWAPEAAESVHLLDPQEQTDVADPLAGTDEDFRHCAATIRGFLERRLPTIMEHAS